MTLGTVSTRVVVSAAAACAAVAACGIGAAVALAPHSGVAAAQSTAPVRYPAPAVTVSSAHGQTVPWSSPLRITVTNAHVDDVHVVDGRGNVLAGSLDRVANRWASDHRLVPLRRYTAQVTLTDRGGERTQREITVRAAKATRHLDATLSPDGAVVGVGQPVVVTFSQSVPVRLRAAVERHLSVATSPATVGAWHWMSDQEVHWRPPTYWQPGTTVTVASDLRSMYFGHGYWGGDQHTATFRVGAAHVSTVNAATHTMTVRVDGTVVRTIAVSTGNDKYPTKGGVHIVLDKAQEVTMDSSTVGIPRNSPDGYYEKVYWDVRISDGGAFVHAAPWSVGSQGRVNVSHGCVNVSTAQAEWFYSFSRPGDIVNVVHSGVAPVLSDPGMADWNLSWSEWLNGDALHS